MLRSQAIVQRQHTCVSGFREAIDEFTMSVDRPDHIPTTVQIENHPIVSDARSGDPFCRNSARIYCGRGRILGHIELSSKRLKLLPEIVNPSWWRGHQFFDCLQETLQLCTRHIVLLFWIC